MAQSLFSSVSSLQSSLSLLSSSISTLENGVSDFPRLRRVLTSTTHFELLPEPTLRVAQQTLHDEIGPSIMQLLGVAGQYIEKLGRREEGLRAKSELMEGRLSNGGRRSRGSSFGQLGSNGRPTLQKKNGTNDDAENAARAAELKKLRQRKERLQYAVDRLELQGKQRERELRKSMALPAGGL